MNSEISAIVESLGITSATVEKLNQFTELQRIWNAQINLISRQDIENIWPKHILPSLAFLKIIQWAANTRVLDVGTGGGFPGIVLAIACPQIQFTLVDSIGKKIKAVAEMAQALGLTNVTTVHGRVETLDDGFDFALGRAVAALPEFFSWVKPKLQRGNLSSLPNGVLYLKGGELEPGVRIDQRWELDTLLPGIEASGKYIVYIKASPKKGR